MLTNGFTREEIAASASGATLNCTESVVMPETSEVTFTAGQTYKIESVRADIMVVKNDEGRPHMIYGDFFRKHFTLNKPRQIVHLSETGLNAGRRFCGAARDDGNRSVHGTYAPLHSPEFREAVCEACLTVWATEAYDDGEAMPAYIAEVRHKHQAVSAGAVGAIGNAPQLALQTQRTLA